MLLGGGCLDRVQLLRSEAVGEIGRNQVGDLAAGVMRTVMPERTNDFVLFPEGSCRWGLAYMINALPGPNGPQRWELELGWNIQQLLLDRSEDEGGGGNPDATAAICGSVRSRGLWRLRTLRVQRSEPILATECTRAVLPLVLRLPRFVKS
jgi:hypothetical protein